MHNKTFITETNYIDYLIWAIICVYGSHTNLLDFSYFSQISIAIIIFALYTAMKFKTTNNQNDCLTFPINLTIEVYKTICFIFCTNHKDWLTHQILISKREICKSSKTSEQQSLLINRSNIYTIFHSINIVSIFNSLKTFYLPSVASTLLVLLITVLPFCNIISFPSKSDTEKSFLDKMINVNVYEALSLVIVALIIFIAEVLRDEKDPDAKRILMKLSNIWPLTIGTILIPVSYLIGDPNKIFIVLEIIIALAIIISFYKIIITLLDGGVSEKDKKAFFRERIKKVSSETIDDRLGNNIFLNKTGIDNEIKLKYSPYFSNQLYQEYIEINAPNGGVIYDINLNELKNTLKFMQERAKLLGFVIYPEKEIPTAGKIDDLFSDIQRDKDKGNLKEVLLLKTYKESTLNEYFLSDSPKTKALLAIPSGFEKDQNFKTFIKDIKERLTKCFLIKDDPTLSEKFRKELSGIKKGLVSAINTNSIVEIEEMKRLYVDISGGFLDALHEYKAEFSSENAKKELSSFDRFRLVYWLGDDINNLGIAALKTQDLDIIKSIGVLNIAIATRALSTKDHLFFQQFTNNLVYLCYRADEILESVDKKKSVYSSINHWLSSIALNNLYYSIKTSSDDRNDLTIEDLKDFGLEIYSIFLQLIKFSIDRKSDSLDMFFNQFNKIYTKFQNIPEENYSAFNGDKTEEIRVILKNEYQIISFGISSWALNKLTSENSNNDGALYKKIIKLFSKNMPNNLKELINIFSAISEDGVADKWGWSWWDMKADGEAHWIDDQSKYNKFFCYKALKILSSNLEDTPLDLTANDKLISILEQQNDYKLALSEIKNKENNWTTILDTEDFMVVDKLNDLLKDLVSISINKKNARIREAEIDQDLLKRFKDGVLKYFYENTKHRKLAQKLGVFEKVDNTKPTEEIPSWGFNKLDDKSVFVKDIGDGYLGWDEKYGKGLAESEDYLSFEKLIKLTSNKKTIDIANLENELEACLQNFDMNKTIIMQSLDYRLEYDYLRKNKSFITKEDSNESTIISDLKGFMGVLKTKQGNISIFDVSTNHKDKLSNKILIINLEKFAVWKQYNPIDKETDITFIKDDLYMNVIDLNKEEKLQSDIVKKEWLIKKYPANEEERYNYLKQLIIIKIYEKFDIILNDPEASICLNINNSEEVE